MKRLAMKEQKVTFEKCWITAKQNPIIRTERLIFRPWRETDAESLYEYAKDPAVGPIVGWQTHKSAEESLHIIQNVLNGAECYAICEKETDIAIGCIKLRLNGHTDMTDHDDECELGFVYHHTSDNVPVLLMNEVRISHTNIMTKEN